MLLAGCDLSMTQQNKYDTYTPASLWADGTSARPLPAHTVAQGDLARDAAEKNPPPVTPTLARARTAALRHLLLALSRPCRRRRRHDRAPRLSGAAVLSRAHACSRRPPRISIDVITHGYGAMYPYADRVDPRDRWAIIAYIRALQLQRHAMLAEAPEAAQKLP